jgi:hypothetical protein
MGILNYTTKIPVEKTISEIESLFEMLEEKRFKGLIEDKSNEE